jgi:hypothetical protein
MTNKEIISYECERLEKIRQELIKEVERGPDINFNTAIKELGEIGYELTAKIKDV